MVNVPICLTCLPDISGCCVGNSCYQCTGFYKEGEYEIGFNDEKKMCGSGADDVKLYVTPTSCQSGTCEVSMYKKTGILYVYLTTRSNRTCIVSIYDIRPNRNMVRIYDSTPWSFFS